VAKGRYHEWLEPDNLDILSSWARRGLTEEQIAQNIGISVRTLSRWKLAHSPICQALKKSKDQADALVENALFKRAVGFRVPKKVTKKKEIVNAAGKTIRTEIQTQESSVYYPPDPTSIAIWLNNRLPQHWRQRREPSDIDSGDRLDALLEKLDEAMG